MPARLRSFDPGPWAAGVLPAALALVASAVSHGSVRAGLAALVVALAGGLHRPRLVRSAAADAGVAVVAALAVGAVTSPSTAVAALIALLATLAVAHALVRRARTRHPRRAVVVGTGPDGRRAAEALLARPGAGLRPVGFVGDDLAHLRGLPLAYLGGLDRLPAVLAETGAEVVVLTEPAAGLPEVATYALPGLTTYAAPGVDRLGDLSLVRVIEAPEPTPSRALRRTGEGLVALVLLVLALPPAALLALLVRLETGGVLVRSDGALRFRTRRARSLARPGTTWSVDIAGRVGPVGRALRRTHLHEWPETLRGLVRRAVGERSFARRRPAPAGRDGLVEPAVDLDQRQPVR